MNRITYTRAITILGKVAALTDAFSKLAGSLTIEEQELIRDAQREYTFYHAHERAEAGIEAPDEVEVLKSVGAGKTRNSRQSKSTG